MIERPAPRALVEWVCERSQGNPLFAIGLLRALMQERGDLSARILERLPEGLTERVISELRRFAAAPRGMLELLAVVGRPVSLGDLTALTGSSLEEVGPVLAELVTAGIVVEEERGSELTYELYHPLVRDVVYQATGGASRRVLHRRAARSLLSTGHLAEAALHFARSAERGDSEAVEVLLDAMRQAERREAFREALDLQAELVDLLPADDQRWLEVLEAMYARAEWLIDHRAETNAPVAIRALRAIDGLLEGSSDHARRAIVKFRLANFLAWGTGELESATTPASRRTTSSFVPATGGRRCWQPASWRGSRACKATLREWVPTPARWSKRRMPSAIGSWRCKAWPRSAIAPCSEGPSPKPRRRSDARRRSPVRMTRRIA